MPPHVFSREVIRAGTYLFLATRVHPVFSTTCGTSRPHVFFVFTSHVSLYPGGSHVYFISPGLSSCQISLPLVDVSAITTTLKSSPSPLHSHIPPWQLLLLFFCFFSYHGQSRASVFTASFSVYTLLLSLPLCLSWSLSLSLSLFPSFEEASKRLPSCVETSSLLPKDKASIIKCWISGFFCFFSLLYSAVIEIDAGA